MQAVVVQLACMLYEAVLVQATNVAHMRLFSVFLALPSATVRFMTASQLQVDDEGRDEQEEDELELAEGAAGATATGGGGSLAPGAAAAASAAVDNADAGEKIKPKSVRMVVVEAGASTSSVSFALIKSATLYCAASCCTLLCCYVDDYWQPFCQGAPTIVTLIVCVTPSHTNYA